MELIRDVVEYPEYDVVVCGGGPAGIGAGIAAARSGVKTLLIEANGCLGGVSTAGGLPFMLGAMGGSISWPEMVRRGLSYSELNRSRRAVSGIFSEMIETMKSAGDGIGPCVVPHNDRYPGLDRLGCHDEFTFDTEKGKLAFDRMAERAGVELLYYSHAACVKTDSGRIKGVYVTNKNGITYIPCKVLIDCTGDADMVNDAGYETYKGDRLTGEMTHAGFIAQIENVDMSALAEHFNLGNDAWFRDICERAIFENPELDLPRRLIMMPLVLDGVVLVNGGMSRYGFDGTSAESLTELTLWARKRAELITEVLFRKYIPGGKNARLRFTSYFPCVRETRRIVGEVTFTEEDMLSLEKRNDVIALAGRHFDLSRNAKDGSPDQPSGKKQHPYGAAGIPYGTLIPKGSKNILVAGRCIAADGQALGPARIMSTCIAVGEAAGTAASIMVKQNIDSTDVDVSELRENLRQHGAIVDL